MMGIKGVCLLVLGACVYGGKVKSQTIIPLYAKGEVPNVKRPDVLYDTFVVKNRNTGKDTLYISNRLQTPTITVFAPPAKKNTGTAVIVCSGGCYGGVADEVEGIPAARKLVEAGITAFVVQYRVPRENTMLNKEIGPLQDAQRAIQYVRTHAKEYHIKKDKIGIMGFSAGGHLVSTIGTHFTIAYAENKAGINLRPDFMVLVYPVISFADSLTHTMSRKNLIGPEITPEKVKLYSNEWQVTSQTPPVFIVHAMDDREVKVANSLYFVAALEEKKVPVELYLYAKGGHGFGPYNRKADAQWIDACISWIGQQPANK